MQDDSYKLNKDDTQIMLHWLRINLPELATPENAVWLLITRKLHIEALDKYHPEVIEQMLKDRQEN